MASDQSRVRRIPDDDCLALADRIVLPFRPSQIVVYAGDNDLAAGKSPNEILEAFKGFVRTVLDALPSARITYISIKPSPVRWQLMDKMVKANQSIAAFTLSDARLSFVDVFNPMLDENGKPREDLFVADKLHMNAKGYALWVSILKPRLSDAVH